MEFVKALLHGKVVEINERSGSLTRVTPEGGDEFDSVWVKTASLKPVPMPHVPKSHVEVASLALTPATDDVVIPTAGVPVPKVPVFLAYATKGDDAISKLVSYLNSSGYRLYLSCKPDSVDAGEGEYQSWTGGECLPENAVRAYEKAYGREWFLTFKYSADVDYPFPIIERGTGGGHGAPCGLHRNGRIELCYWQIIEQLVRAGLRV